MLIQVIHLNTEQTEAYNEITGWSFDILFCKSAEISN